MDPYSLLRPYEVSTKREEPSKWWLTCVPRKSIHSRRAFHRQVLTVFFSYFDRLEVRDLLVANIPDVFNQLLGHKNARRGTLKVLDALQDERLNKQLFYDILEVILKDGFPELSNL